MTSGGEATESSQYRLKLLDPLGNVTLLERPLRMATLVSAIRTALRARRRQYEIADYIAERESLLAQLRHSEQLYRSIGDPLISEYGCVPRRDKIYMRVHRF